jgi:hypothetical protein
MTIHSSADFYKVYYAQMAHTQTCSSSINSSAGSAIETQQESLFATAPLLFLTFGLAILLFAYRKGKVYYHEMQLRRQRRMLERLWQLNSSHPM